MVDRRDYQLRDSDLFGETNVPAKGLAPDRVSSAATELPRVRHTHAADFEDRLEEDDSILRLRLGVDGDHAVGVVTQLLAGWIDPGDRGARVILRVGAEVGHARHEHRGAVVHAV